MASAPPVDLEVCIDSLESAAEAVQKGILVLYVSFLTDEKVLLLHFKTALNFYNQVRVVLKFVSGHKREDTVPA